MPNLNLFTGIGHLTRDPELRYAPSGTAIAKFTIAINHRSGGGDSGKDPREEVLFLRCTAFQKTAELVNTYCKKGNPICVIGRLQQQEWEDKESGAKRTAIELIAERVQFLGQSSSTKSDDSSSASF